MYWKITKDHLWQEGDSLPSREGWDYGSRVIADASKEHLLKVRLLDDDGELYYEAEADDDALENLWEWAMHDAGATLLQVRENGKWVDTIA